MSLDFGIISVNVCFICLAVLYCPAILLALIKIENHKIDRDLFVHTWHVRLVEFGKDCVCCQQHRKQHGHIGPHRAYGVVGCFSVGVCGFGFFDCRRIVTQDFEVSAQATQTCCRRYIVGLTPDIVKLN